MFLALLWSFSDHHGVVLNAQSNKWMDWKSLLRPPLCGDNKADNIIFFNFVNNKCKLDFSIGFSCRHTEKPESVTTIEM